jgi:hypothetical protein
MRHVFGKDRKHQIKFLTLKENDLDAIKEIKTLSESKPYYAIRSDEKYFEILSSWSQKTYVGYIDNEFIGYAVVKSGVSEMLLKDESMIQEFVCALFDHLGNSSLQISIPAFLPNYVDALIGICESYCLETSKFFSVLNYKKVVEAFMELKATYTDLPDGKIVLDINGKAGNEKIAVSVNNGKISVEYTDDAADLTLEHIEAMNLLFAPISIKRDRLPDFVKMWFPLPIYVYSSDAV